MLSLLSRKLFHALGWRLEGRYPEELKKKILIVAPHTASVDFFVGLMVKFWLNIKATFYAKKELFTGIRGWFLRALGASPVDRSKSTNLVDQIVKDFNEKDEHTIVITPEGTRKKVKKFKSGFYHVANKAKVPIIPIYFDFENKVVGILDPVYTKGNAEEEIRQIENLYRGIKGKVPKYSFG